MSLKRNTMWVIVCLILGIISVAGIITGIVIINRDEREDPDSQAYTVTWKSYDGTVLYTDDSVVPGETPVYKGEKPVKPSDERYNYTHSGWTPEVSAITQDTVYTATFTESVRLYTVNWVSDGTVLKSESLPYGSTPAYSGAVPTKQANAQYSYAFDSWTPSVSAVVSDVTYNASFSTTLNTYTVEFYSEDGTTLWDTVTVAYGATAAFTKTVPEKPETESHKNEFCGWVSAPGGSEAVALSGISCDIKVYASYATVLKGLTVTLCTSNADFGSVSVQTIPNVPYGSQISVSGNSVTVGGVTVVATESERNAEFTYSFVEWTADTATVTNDTVITAVFERTKNTYPVVWKNTDGSTLKTDNLEYGITPAYNGTAPKHPTEPDGLYLFDGWTPTVAGVTESAVYVAKYIRNESVKVVTFYDEDGVTVLGKCLVENGSDAVYPGAAPIKAPTAEKIYTFDKWLTEKNGSTEASLSNINADTSVYASYSASARTYEVTFKDWDGSVISVENVAYGMPAAAPTPTPERAGYAFIGWSVSIDEICSDMTVEAQYAELYTVIFIDQGENVISSQSLIAGADIIAPESPLRVGYTLSGWNTKADGSGADYADPAILDENVLAYLNDGAVKIYAQWTPNEYTVIYNANIPIGATNSVEAIPASSVWTYDSDGELLSAPTLFGWSFEGWYLDEDCTLKLGDAGETISKPNLADSGTVNIYARWSPKKYTVSYDSNGGEGTTAPSSHTYDSYSDLTESEITRTGYVLWGWSTAADATAPTYMNGEGVVNVSDSDVTLYAVWHPTEACVTYTNEVTVSDSGYQEEASPDFDIDFLKSLGYARIEISFEVSISRTVTAGFNKASLCVYGRNGTYDLIENYSFDSSVSVTCTAKIDLTDCRDNGSVILKWISGTSGSDADAWILGERVITFKAVK